jgi:hypothetical protein
VIVQGARDGAIGQRLNPGWESCPSPVTRSATHRLGHTTRTRLGTFHRSSRVLQLVVLRDERDGRASPTRSQPPLWEDVRTVTERLIDAPAGYGAAPVPPHFLGAIVLDQQFIPAGFIAVRHVVDGQQRLTTLQLLLDAAQYVVEQHGTPMDAQALRVLVLNDPQIAQHPDEVFKVWPTDRDQVDTPGEEKPNGGSGAVPGQRYPTAVAAGGVPGPLPGGILQDLDGEVLDLGQAEFFALVDVGAAGEGEGEEAAARDVFGRADCQAGDGADNDAEQDVAQPRPMATPRPAPWATQAWTAFWLDDVERDRQPGQPLPPLLHAYDGALPEPQAEQLQRSDGPLRPRHRYCQTSSTERSDPAASHARCL